jgi:hypothetical protein
MSTDNSAAKPHPADSLTDAELEAVVRDGGCLTPSQYSELSTLVRKALALSDVLNTAANGDTAMFECVHDNTLSEYSGMLYELLFDAQAIIDGTVDAKIATKEAAHV